MAVDIQAEILINRPRSDVARFATDPANDPAWIGGVVEATLLGAPPLSKDAKVRRVAKFLGRRIEYVTEVEEWQPPATLAMRTTSPFPMTIRYEFLDRGDGTLARIRVQGEGSGFFKLAEPLLGRLVKRNVGRDLETLKGLLETEPPADGGDSTERSA